jgi:Tol biopolymer transport system component
MTRMIMGDGHRYIEEQLFWFTRDGWQPLDVGLAQAYGPSWSPDGKQIAFIGSKGRGSPTAGSEYDLYLMNTDGSDVHALAKGFLHAVGVSWSPDGRWIAFSAAPEGKRGLWLVDPTTGKMRLIAEGAFDVPRWSPDGQEILTVQFEPAADPPKDRIVIVEVGPVLGD